MFNHYINLLKNNYLEESKQPKDSLRYSMWLKNWKEENPQFSQYIDDDDDFYATVGSRIIEI